jgi:ribokinase
VRVICVGDVMVDVVAQLPGELAVGSDTPAPIALLGGGSAANTAAWCVRAGLAATFVGRVGDDALGRTVIDELARGGIDLEVSVDPELPTGICIVLVAPDGERTMVPAAGANTVGGTPPPLRAGDHLHVSGYALFQAGPAAAAAAAALAAAGRAGCPMSLDAASAAPLAGFGAERFLDLAAGALVLANTDEAAVLTGAVDPAAAARMLGARCGEAIVKCGRDGAVWSDGTDVVLERGAPVVPVDSTGAGDAFAAGVLAARLGGAPPAAALRAGNALAATAITRRGARP